MEEIYHDSSYVLFEDHIFNIEKQIAMFNKDTVIIQDLSTHRQTLDDIFEEFSNFERKFLDLRRNLDRNNSSDVQKLDGMKIFY